MSNLTTPTTFKRLFVGDDDSYAGVVPADDLLHVAGPYGPVFRVGSTATADYAYIIRRGLADVRAFGAVGDGVTNDTAAIQAAATSLATTGGTLYFPAGTYLFTTSVFLSSNTSVIGDGPSTILKAIAGASWVLGPGGSSAYISAIGRILFYNINWTSATIVDQNYLFSNFAVDLDTAASVQRKGFATFVSARNIEFHSITTRGGGGVIQFLHTANSSVHDCTFLDFHSTGADHFSGFTDARVQNNYFRQTAVSSANPAIQFTGTNNDNTNNTSDGVICTGNEVFCTGGYLFNVAGISITAAGFGGTVNNAVISDNVIDMDGLAAGGVINYGAGDNWRICNNEIRNVTNYNVLLAFGNGYGTPTRVYVANNRLINCTRTSGGATLLSVTAVESTVVDNDCIACTATTAQSLNGNGGLLRLGNVTGGSITTPYATTGTVTVDGQTSGTWTPAVQFGGLTTGITYSAQVGTWKRQGNIMFVRCQLVLTSKGSATGAAQIGGAPVGAGTGPLARFGIVGAANFNIITVEPVVRISASTFTLVTTAMTGGTNLDDTHFANNTNLTFEGWYFVP